MEQQQKSVIAVEQTAAPDKKKKLTDNSADEEDSLQTDEDLASDGDSSDDEENRYSDEDEDDEDDQPADKSKNPKINDIGLITKPDVLQKKQQEQDYNQVLKQNININKKDTQKSMKLASQSRHQDQERNLDQHEIERIQEKIEMYHRDQEQLQNEKMEIESKGWDLKFQNYWGYIVAASNNFEQS